MKLRRVKLSPKYEIQNYTVNGFSSYELEPIKMTCSVSEGLKKADRRLIDEAHDYYQPTVMIPIHEPDQACEGELESLY